MKETTKKFCSAHAIKIIDQNKRAMKFAKVNIQYFRDPEDYNILNQELLHETETLYTVEISETELEKIAEFENQVFNNMKHNGHYDMFNFIMEQKEREKYLKERFPAVKKAYEHYSLILKMAEAGEIK